MKMKNTFDAAKIRPLGSIRKFICIVHDIDMNQSFKSLRYQKAVSAVELLISSCKAKTRPSVPII